MPLHFVVRMTAPCALALALAVPVRIAAAQSATEELLASGTERPAQLGRYRAATEADVAELVAVYERPAAARHVRLRALSALAEAAGGGSERAQDYLHELLRRADQADGGDVLHPARSPLVLTRALHGFRRAPRVLSNHEFSRCLAHAHPSVRQAAVELLATEHSERAASMLSAQRAHERSPRVLRALNAAAPR